MQATELSTERAKSDQIGGDPFADDTYFLSSVNMTATTEQRDLEALALEWLDSPVIQQAQAGAEARFRIFAGKHNSHAPDEAFVGIESKLREWAYHYLLLALNSDPNYPKVLGHGYGPPHNWMGMEVPGCRGLGTAENPDNHYIFIPIDVHGRFELHGKAQSPAIEDANFWLTSCLSQSINVTGLNRRDIDIEDDGSFVITIDRNPAEGRRNHLQSTVDTQWLFVRDSRKDWDQRPNAYRIRRLDPPTAPRLSIEEMLQIAKRSIIDDVPMNFWFRAMAGFLEPNTLSEISLSSGYGGMATQKLMRGRLALGDDDAYVLTLGGGGSDYWVLTLYDWWLMSGDYWKTTSTVNDSQTVANPDGSHTYVFSIKDPGVHNWVSTEGLHDSLFMNRWQMMPVAQGGVAGGQPTATGELVKLDALRTVLPQSTKWVTSQERQRQLADRLASFNRRHEL